uniref:DNA-directed RNA polymerase n=1 Tax=Isolepis setacea TaxID=76460 RepID=A0A889Q2G3_9POAL|nr:RNA polymerase alpha subunit [Isolepis setacea]QRE78404.1 RNA polymerase alpha subunit [Isolepis setacea]ULQ66398.1 RNA polymerase alpha subunit [Isolepis setacea]
MSKIKKKNTFKMKWKCIESRIENPCLHYSRFILSPFQKGQADTLGTALRRTLLSEIQGTAITYIKYIQINNKKLEKVSHEYSHIEDVKESIHEIILNLKQIVLKSCIHESIFASICVSGPMRVTAEHIKLPSSVQVINKSQYIATITKPIDFSIDLVIERDRGFRVNDTRFSDLGYSYSIDALFMPVRNVNYNIHISKDGENEKEILFLEIWTNGSLTPREALRQASLKLIGFLHSFLFLENDDDSFSEEENKKLDNEAGRS